MSSWSPRHSGVGSSTDHHRELSPRLEGFRFGAHQRMENGPAGGGPTRPFAAALLGVDWYELSRLEPDLLCLGTPGPGQIDGRRFGRRFAGSCWPSTLPATRCWARQAAERLPITTTPRSTALQQKLTSPPTRPGFKRMEKRGFRPHGHRRTPEAGESTATVDAVGDGLNRSVPVDVPVFGGRAAASSAVQCPWRGRSSRAFSR